MAVKYTPYFPGKGGAFPNVFFHSYCNCAQKLVLMWSLWQSYDGLTVPLWCLYNIHMAPYEFYSPISVSIFDLTKP